MIVGYLGKKAYVPPYTPKATVDGESMDDKVRVSSTGLSRSLVIEPVKKASKTTYKDLNTILKTASTNPLKGLDKTTLKTALNIP